MICKPCQIGADIMHDPNSAAPVRTRLVEAQRAHGMCRGCDCQHAETTSNDAGAPDSILTVVVDSSGMVTEVRCGDVLVPYAVVTEPGAKRGFTVGEITKLEVGPAYLAAEGCRSEIPVTRSGDAEEVGWTCDADPDRLVEVGRLSIPYPNGRSRRVPIVAPREQYLALPEDSPQRQGFSYAVPFGGERDHVHLNMRPQA